MSLDQATATYNAVQWAILFLLGAAFGSFATVLEARVPSGRSIVKPRSACPNCGHQLSWHENIPILGWLLLRGRCAGCHSPISVKYPLIELSTAFLFLLAFTPGPDPKFGAGNLAMAAMAVVTVPLVMIDLEFHRLPNAITYPTGIFLLVLMAAHALLMSDLQGSWGVLLSGVIPALTLLTLGLISRGGMGLGDVKLAALMGWSAGWFGIAANVTGFVIAFLLGGCYALVVLLSRRGTRKSAIPFGPFLLAGLWVAFAGGQLLQNVVLSVWGF